MAKLPTKGLIMAHLNVCSLRNKIHEIERLAQLYNFHILTVSETHLDPSIDNDEISIQGYNIFRKDRNSFGGGVAVFVQSHIPVETKHDLIIDDIEALWVVVHLPHTKPILIGCCYRPPSANVNYLNKMCSVVDKASDGSRELYLFGDMNIDWFSTNCHLKCKLLSMAKICHLKQMVSHPTRISTNKHGTTSSTCIDLVFTNSPEQCSNAVSLEVGFSDHNVVVLSRKTKLPRGGNMIVHKRSYKHFNKEAFVKEVEQVDWSVVCQEMDPEKALSFFMNLFTEIANRHAPLKKFSVRSRGAPWIDQKLRDLMTSRDTAKKIANTSGLQSDRQVYCKLRNLVTKLNRQKKKVHYIQRISDVKNDGKKLWSTLNEVMGRKSKTVISFIQSGDGAFITKPLDIANHFNIFFKSKVNNLRSGFSNSDGSLSQTLIGNSIMKNKNCLFQFSPINSKTVNDLLLAQADSASPGMDNLDSKLIKLVVEFVTSPICHIFNQCLSHGVHPTIWKEAKIIPLPKDKNKSFNGPNSRPISILPLLSKVVEKIVFNQVMDYFSANNLLSSCQHAYREDHSTSTALAQMTDDWLTGMDKSKLVGAVMLDFSAAFDIINHSLLINKLQCYGFSPRATSWFKHYLTDRKQCVFFNGSYSNQIIIDCGVPQGSCLGPLLYTIFTNDLPLCVKDVNIVMYADDTTLYWAATSEQSVTETLSSALTDVNNWVQHNQLVLNIAKTKSIVFGSRHRLVNNPVLNLSINNNNIEQVNSIKLLGLTIDKSLSWSNHIKNIVSKIGKGISMTRKCSAFVTPSIIKPVIHSLALSHLEYCSVIWSSALKSDMKKLQVAQNKAARLVLGCFFRTNTAYMHRQLNWLTVVQKGSLQLLMLLRSVISTNNPLSLANQLQLTATHGYSTRRAASGYIMLPAPKTNYRKLTVIYRSIELWNVMPHKIISTVNNKKMFRRLSRKYLLCTSTE